MAESSINLEEILSGNPYGTEYGKLANGLTYYVKMNDRPQMRAHLVLAVRAGSVLEKDGQEGVAHIIEHLAFSATSSYEQHDIMKFLEGMGLRIGACQNAETSVDGTFYKLIVPIDVTENLSKALSILSEFSSEIRISAEDLDDERGPILQEYRESKDIRGRMWDTLWELLFEDSEYQRSPIGLEQVIQAVTPETVKEFYSKWYNFNNIAVIAIVVDLIKKHFESKVSSPVNTDIPRFLVPAHSNPRFKCFVDSEVSKSYVEICFKTPVNESPMTVKDYRERVVEFMYQRAIQRRFDKVSQKIDRPYFACGIEAGLYAKPVKVHVLRSLCKESEVLLALESMLTELARVRLHGFSDQETSLARKLILSKLESAYLQRDQTESVHFQKALIQHFMHDEPVLSIEREVELRRQILNDISPSDIFEYSKNFHYTGNCVIMTTQPRDGVTVKDLEAAVIKIKSLEDSGSISSWSEQHIPEEIVTAKPEPGTLVKRSTIQNIGATELMMSNGMRLCYKCTDFHTDQVLISGFAYGGLSEVLESEYLSCLLASEIAGKIGIFGYKPSLLKDIIIGKTAVVDARVELYRRRFNGFCSSADFETALQLIHQLFVANVIPNHEDFKMVMDSTKSLFDSEENDQSTVFESAVNEYTNGESYFTRVISNMGKNRAGWINNLHINYEYEKLKTPKRVGDLANIDLYKACDFFNDCYKDPSNFTVVIVGSLDSDVAIPLILKYMAGIPRPSDPVMKFNRDGLKQLPYTFPIETVRKVVHFPTIEESSTVNLSFPLLLKNEEWMEYSRFIALWENLLSTKLFEVLRFELKEIYNCEVSVNSATNVPSNVGNFCGHLTVEFSCRPEVTQSLVDATLKEIRRLQDEGPVIEELKAALEIHGRESEIDSQMNDWWLERIMTCYQSRIYSGDVSVTFDADENDDATFIEKLTPEVAQTALRKIIPFPCTDRYTLVTLMPADNSVEDSE